MSWIYDINIGLVGQKKLKSFQNQIKAVMLL